MKKKEYQLFRHINESGQFYLIAAHDFDPNFERYRKLYKDSVKMIKEFDDLEEAIRFRNAINML